MRPGQQQHQKRMRGRNNNRGKGGNQHNRSFESNGPDVKIRGTAAHIADKYVQLARDAQSSGDPVAAENYLQHAEHYYRIVAASQPQYPQGQGGQPQGFQRADDDEGDEEGGEGQANGFDGNQNGGENRQQGYQQQQPYEQRDNRDHQQREPRQHNNEGGLPAFITGGGGGDYQGGQDRGDRDFRNNRRNNRRFGRYGRNGGPNDQQPGNAPEGNAPGGAEPEVAPGE